MNQIYQKLQDRFSVFDLTGSAWAESLSLGLTEEMVPQLSIRARHVLFEGLRVKTFGELFALDVETVLGTKNAGVKTVREILELRDGIFRDDPATWIQKTAMAEGNVEGALADDTEIPALVLQRLSVRSRNVLLSFSAHPTVDELCRLDRRRLKAMRGVGNKVVSELMALRERFVAGRTLDELEADQPSASDFESLKEMLLALDGTGKEQVRKVMERYMGLLNVQERQNLEACGRGLGVSRERVRQIAAKIEKQLFCCPRRKALSEIETLVREMFEATDDRVVMPEAVIAKVESTFGWTGTTAFSLWRLLEYLGWKIEELPEGRGWGWNEDGRFDWVETYRPPTLTERRRAAIKRILTDAGYGGLTIDEVVASCSRDYPDLGIEVGNVKGAMSGTLDDEGTRIIPYDRGTRQKGTTRYSLNTFFHDAQTKAVLKKAAKRIRAYMEKTGLGVVSVWKASREHQSELPRPLPKLGFYMMMRDFKSGGLVYQDYPRIAYPGIKLGENTFPWMLYMYCAVCRHPKATFAEIMYFFTECLGLQPSIAVSCAFNSMGLKKAGDAPSAPYVVKPPVKGGNPPDLFLENIRNYLDFSLIKVPEKSAINPYFLDEDGRALTHGTYAKIFFRALEEKQFEFPASELAGLQDKGWCRAHFKSYRPVLRKAGVEKRPTVSGYWRERFRFNDEYYFVSDDWEARNKSEFDRWATRIASLAGVEFSPYEVRGLSLTNDDDYT